MRLLRACCFVPGEKVPCGLITNGCHRVGMWNRSPQAGCLFMEKLKYRWAIQEIGLERQVGAIPTCSKRSALMSTLCERFSNLPLSLETGEHGNFPLFHSLFLSLKIYSHLQIHWIGRMISCNKIAL